MSASLSLTEKVSSTLRAQDWLNRHQASARSSQRVLSKALSAQLEQVHELKAHEELVLCMTGACERALAQHELDLCLVRDGMHQLELDDFTRLDLNYAAVTKLAGLNSRGSDDLELQLHLLHMAGLQDSFQRHLLQRFHQIATYASRIKQISHSCQLIRMDQKRRVMEILAPGQQN